MCLADARLFLPGLNLAYTDRSSMAASIEVRVPFVDPVVFAGRVRHPGPGRSAGRHAEGGRSSEAARAVAPDATCSTGPKASFGAPLRAWVTHDLGAVIDDMLVDGELVAVGRSCGPSRCAAWSRTSAAGRGTASKQLWQLLSMELWYRDVRAAGVGPPERRQQTDREGR